MTGIVEKPEHPASKFGVTGIYCYDADVFDVIPTLVPSGRGELEITDVNNHYIAPGVHGLRRARGLLGRRRRVDRRVLHGQRLRPHGTGPTRADRAAGAGAGPTTAGAAPGPTQAGGTPSHSAASLRWRP